MTTNEAISNAVKEFEKVMVHLKEEFSRLQIGRANAGLVEGANVEMYGVTQPLKNIANISIPDPRTIMIQPWDKSSIVHIEKAIVGMGTGLNPISDGVCVRVPIPPLTEERRTDLTKHVRRLAEDAKISIRTARQDVLGIFKQLKANDEITEDDVFSSEKALQVKVDEFNGKIDEVTTAKEKDVMTV
ncbi:ribosome recycling factor [Candidatus Peregrinibacteria bacterium CG_4_10_14_0_2_um_filter_38_24]|nr:MAG: ribosome recycling factor [Candidatus Peregrinibacteria bacterium CG_4_10_14_0_2_um_filter_38_24]